MVGFPLAEIIPVVHTFSEGYRETLEEGADVTVCGGPGLKKLV